MDFDDILVELGEMGAYQVKIYLLICLPIIFSAANSLTYVFVAGVPKYRCLVPNCEDPATAEYHADWLPIAIPNSKNSFQNYTPSQCTRYEKNHSYPNTTCIEEVFLPTVEKCDKWVFDNERTVVNEFGITCLENEWKLSLAGGAHFVGILIGSAFFGFMADKFGRKRIFIFCIIFMSITGVFQVLSPNYTFFLILLFANAFGTAGVYPLAFILGVELVGKSKREITAIVLNYFYAVGEAFVGLFAWLYEDWVPLQLTASGPCLVFLCYHWIIPESVRWLLAKNRKSKAKEIVIEAAKFNQVDLSDMIMMSFEPEYTPDDASPEKEEKNEKSPWNMIKYIFKSKKLVLRFVIIIFIWTVNAFVYYGLSINSVNISGNKYLNFVLVCLVEIPGYTLSWICMSKFGRKPTLVLSFLLCGITCAASIVPSGITWIEVSLFLIGKLGITSSFGVVYCHTAEMLPTVIRSGGVGLASTSARIGSILAPFVPLIGKYVAVLPMILFAGVSLLAGLVSLKLPETLGTKLPETIEEADNL